MHRCQRCGHDYKYHGHRGSEFRRETYSIERIDHGSDGIEIREDVTLCECPYFLGRA